MTDFNLLPSITHNPETDKTRLDLVIDHYAVMKKGSPDKKHHKRGPVIPEVGSLYHKEIIPLGISYTKIALTGVLVELPVIKDGKEITPEKVHNYEICENRILIDGYFVCDAPDKHDNGKKFTPAQKLTFCKAVIWQLLHDEGSLAYQISQLSLTEIPRVIRDEVPAPVIIPAVPAAVPVDICIEHITGSALPGPGLLSVPEYDLYQESVIQKEMIDEGPEEPVYERDEIADHNNNLQKVIEFDQMQTLKEAFPVDVIRSWSVPQLRITIQECALS